MFGQLMQNATPDVMSKLFDQLTAKLGGADKLAQMIQGIAGPAAGGAMSAAGTVK